MPKFQLYHSRMRFILPWSVSYSRKTGEAIVKNRVTDNNVYTFWPNGAPCLLVNLWLQSISLNSTGASAETFASHMSHFIRDIYHFNIQLFEVNDQYLHDFAERLEKEKKLKNNTLHSARNQNHIAYTLRRVIDFYFWYQINYRLNSQTKLIGELGTGAMVTIKWKTDSLGRPYLYHPAIPTKAPLVGDKKPMPDDFIGKLADTVETLRGKPRRPFGISNGPKSEILNAKNEYLYSRRNITLKLQGLTGLRPDELNNIPVELNSDPVKTRKLIIPTSKRRKKPAPLREFQLTLEDALEISIYLDDRQKFVETIGAKRETATNFLLSQSGTSVETRSIARDFRRLCELAGLESVQVCLSMFRHRFITTQIAYEINKELKRDIAQKDLWLEAVQRKILSRVAKLTGHLDPMSLKHYFSEAFAIAVTKFSKPGQNEVEALITKLETDLYDIINNSDLTQNLDLARTIASLEKAVGQLKKLQIQNSSKS